MKYIIIIVFALLLLFGVIAIQCNHKQSKELPTKIDSIATNWFNRNTIQCDTIVNEFHDTIIISKMDTVIIRDTIFKVPDIHDDYCGVYKGYSLIQIVEQSSKYPQYPNVIFTKAMKENKTYESIICYSSDCILEKAKQDELNKIKKLIDKK